MEPDSNQKSNATKQPAEDVRLAPQCKGDLLQSVNFEMYGRTINRCTINSVREALLTHTAENRPARGFLRDFYQAASTRVRCVVSEPASEWKCLAFCPCSSGRGAASKSSNRSTSGKSFSQGDSCSIPFPSPQELHLLCCLPANEAGSRREGIDV